MSHTYIVSGLIGVIKDTTQEELIPYDDFSCDVQTNAAYDARDREDFSFMCAMLVESYRKHLVATNQLEPFKGQNWMIDVMSCGFVRKPKA